MIDFKISEDYQVTLDIDNKGEKVEVDLTLPAYIIEDLEDEITRATIGDFDMSKINLQKVQRTGQLDSSDLDLNKINLENLNQNYILGNMVYKVNEKEIENKLELKQDIKKSFIKFLGKFTFEYFDNLNHDENSGK